MPMPAPAWVAMPPAHMASGGHRVPRRRTIPRTVPDALRFTQLLKPPLN